jgi:hypothetical protein
MKYTTRWNFWQWMLFIGMLCIMGGMTQELFTSISLAATVHAQHIDSAHDTLSPYVLEAKLRIPSVTPTPTPRAPRPIPFSVGEEFTYSVNWGSINAGTVVMRVADIIDYEGHQVYQVLVKADSNAFLSVFYPIHDVLESLIDVDGLFSRRYWTKQDEGGEKRERKYEFDHENNVVHYKDNTYFITHGIHDEVSAVFYVRTLDLEVGTPVYVDIFAKRQNWRVKCDVVTTATLDVGAGTFETILVEPELKFDGIMKKGKIKAWFTHDEHRIPVQVKSKIAIGSITMELEAYQLGD